MATNQSGTSCVAPDIGTAHAPLSPQDVCKLVFLSLILLVGLAGNLVLAGILCRRATSKPTIFTRLLKTRSGLGVCFVLGTIPFHMSVIIAGAHIKSEKHCFVFGSIFQVMFATWLWIQAIILVERYLKILKPSEHMAMYSVINIKIITWGVILMQIMLAFGPVYGWGRYSHSEGRISLQIDRVNLSYFSGSNASDPRMPSMDVLKPVFKDYSIRLESRHALPPKLCLELYSSTLRDAHCLWHDYTMGILAQALTPVLANGIRLVNVDRNPSPAISGSTQAPDGPDLNFDVGLVQKDYQSVVSRDYGYINGTGCELDFTVTSGDDRFYVLVVMVLQFLFPVALVGFCLARILYRVWICVPRSRICLSPRELRDTVEALACAVIILLFYVPYISCNVVALHAGARTPSEQTHFAMRALLYLTGTLPMLVRAVIHRHALAYRASVTDSLRRKTQTLLSTEIPSRSARSHTDTQPSPDTDISTSSITHARISPIEQCSITTQTNVT